MVIMSYDEHVIEFVCRRKITDPEAIRLAREYEWNPATLSAKDTVYAFYKMMGYDVEYDEIFAD